MYRIYIDDFWLIGDIIILKTINEQVRDFA